VKRARLRRAEEGSGGRRAGFAIVLKRVRGQGTEGFRRAQGLRGWVYTLRRGSGAEKAGLRKGEGRGELAPIKNVLWMQRSTASSRAYWVKVEMA
jgi:hypothetical protein